MPLSLSLSPSLPLSPVQSMEEEFVRWMDWYGKSYGEFELLKGDFLDAEFDEILQSATLVKSDVYHTCLFIILLISIFSIAG